MKVISEIAFGNYGLAQIGEEIEFCFTTSVAKRLAEKPELSILEGNGHLHAWNVMDGLIIDLTVLRSVKKLGAPIQAQVACSVEPTTDKYGFNLAWYAYSTYPAQEMRDLFARYR